MQLLKSADNSMDHIQGSGEVHDTGTSTCHYKLFTGASYSVALIC